jgi:large subunit ribosomal protein L10
MRCAKQRRNMPTQAWAWRPILIYLLKDEIPMSKYVKNLISDHLRKRLDGVQDALVVNVIGLSANANNRIRTELAGKKIHVMVIKNSLAARAFSGTSLEPMFKDLSGTAAVCWGGEDIVSLAKEIARLSGDEKNKPFEARGGVLDGERLSAVQVADVAKWPNRAEQLSILVGQILSPGASLASQLESAGGALASQIEQKAEAKEEETKEAEVKAEGGEPAAG